MGLFDGLADLESTGKAAVDFMKQAREKIDAQTVCINETLAEVRALREQHEKILSWLAEIDDAEAAEILAATTEAAAVAQAAADAADSSAATAAAAAGAALEIEPTPEEIVPPEEKPLEEKPAEENPAEKIEEKPAEKIEETVIPSEKPAAKKKTGRHFI